MADLTELFSSVQGEGPYVGRRQIFVRFYGCHRSCAYCDTPETVTAWQPKGHRPAAFRFEQAPGQRDFRPVPNRVSPEKLFELIGALDRPRGLHHSIALTGGEPLLHAKFLRDFLPILAGGGHEIYLETTGDLVEPLELVLPWIDIVAMDIKLPSVTKNRERWESHRGFLERCTLGECDLFAKVVVNADTDAADVAHAVRIVSEAAPTVPFVIQPVTPFGDARNAPSPTQLLRWHQMAADVLPDVRVIPQCHKRMGQP